MAPTMGLYSRFVDWLTPSASDSAAADVAKAEAPAASSPTEPVGVSGYSHFGGYLGTTEKNSEMIGASRWKNFDDWKRNVVTVGLGLRTYLTFTGLPTWTVEAWKARDAEEPTPDDKERAEWLDDQLRRISWRTRVQEGSLATWDGLSFQAWTLRLDKDGRYGIDELLHLPPHTIERWMLDERGQVLGIVQRNPSDGTEHPIERARLVWHRDLPITDHPEGAGILRQLGEAVRQMKALLQLQHKGFEHDVSGIPAVFGPLLEKRKQIGKQVGGRVYTAADFDAEFRDVMAFADAKVRKGAGLILDSSTYPNSDGSPSNIPLWKLEVLAAPSTSHAVIAQEIRRLSWEILAMAGLEYLLLGQDGSGSLAMATAKMAGTLRVVTSVLNGIAETFRRDLVMPLWAWNGWDPETAPTLTWAAIELQDIPSAMAAVGDFLQKAGASPDRVEEIVNFFLEHLGAPRMKAYDDADLVLRREEERAAAVEAAGLSDEDPDEDDDPEEE